VLPSTSKRPLLWLSVSTRPLLVLTRLCAPLLVSHPHPHTQEEAVAAGHYCAGVTIRTSGTTFKGKSPAFTFAQ